MKKEVEDAFFRANQSLEGYVPYMYQDIKGLVTIGVGNLIDPITVAEKLPFVRWAKNMPMRLPATKKEIQNEWRRVKAMPPGLHYKHYSAGSTITMAETDIEHLVSTVLATHEAGIMTHHPAWNEYPALVQMTLLSMSWAVGVTGLKKFSRFNGFIREGSWALAAGEAVMNSSGNPGLERRNKWNLAMLNRCQANMDLLKGNGY